MARARVMCKCGTANDRLGGRRKCVNCGAKLRQRRGQKHARTLQDHSWEHYNAVNADIHGVTDGSCAVCGRPEHESMHHHREHDHVTGLPRGLVCFQCNALMPRLLTLQRARLVTAYLERVEGFYAGSGAYSTSQEARERGGEVGNVRRD